MLPGVIGTIQATEALKLVLGAGSTLVGRLLLYDAWTMKFRELKLRRDPACPVCGDHPSIKGLIVYEEFCGVVSDAAAEAAADSTITPRELRELLDSGKPLALIDVREPVEWDIVHIEGAKLIPKDHILSGEALSELLQNRPIVLHCKTGIRSAEALAEDLERWLQGEPIAARAVGRLERAWRWCQRNRAVASLSRFRFTPGLRHSW